MWVEDSSTYTFVLQIFFLFETYNTKEISYIYTVDVQKKCILTKTQIKKMFFPQFAKSVQKHSSLANFFGTCPLIIQ